MQFFDKFKKAIFDRDPWFASILLSITILISFSRYVFFSPVLLIALTAYLFKPNLKLNSITKYILTPYMLFSILWLIVVFFNSNVPFSAFTGVAVLVAIPMTYLLATEYEGFDQSWRVIKLLLIVLSVIFSVWALYQVGHNVGKGLAEGPYNDRNTFACLMNALWFLVTWQFIAYPKSSESNKLGMIEYSGLIIAFFFVTLTIFVSSSRGAMLAWALLSPIMFYFGYKFTKNKYQILFALIMTVIAYGVSGYIFESNLENRTFALSQDQSTIARLQLWIATLHMAVDYPLFGIGWNNFAFFYPQYRDWSENSTVGIYSHNDYLQLAAEGGFVAFLLIVGLLLHTLNNLKNFIFSSYKSTANKVNIKSNRTSIGYPLAFEVGSLLLGTTAILIHAGVNFIFYYPGINMVLGIYLARIAYITEVHKKILLPNFPEMRRSIKSLVWKFLGLLVFTPFVVHALLQFTFTGDRPVLKFAEVIGIKLDSFKLASLTANLYPYNQYAQDYLIRTYESLLLSPNKNLNPVHRKEMLQTAIKDFDTFRSYNANWASLGASEVRLILANLDIDDSEYQLRNKAYKILDENLKSNIYHSETYILKAQMQNKEGLYHAANETIDLAAKRMLYLHDFILVNLQYLLQKKVLSELKVREVKSVQNEMIMVKNFLEKGYMLDALDETYERGHMLIDELSKLPDAD